MSFLFYTRKCYAAIKNAIHIYIYVALRGTDANRYDKYLEYTHFLV